MLICQYCGHQEMSDEENFCNRCGAPLRSAESRIAVSGGDKMVVHGGEKLAVSAGDKIAASQTGAVATVQPSAAPAVKQQGTTAVANKTAKAVPTTSEVAAAKPARRGMTTTGMIFSIVALAITMLITWSMMGETDEDLFIGGAVVSFIPAILAVLGVIFSAVTMKRNPSKGKNIVGLICGGIALMQYTGMIGSCLGVVLSW